MSRFTFYTPEKMALARLTFSQLVISGPDDGDKFFEAFCPGNTTEIIDRPFERFEDYEMFLRTIKNDDQDKYVVIHKGTPLYYLAWIAFDLRNYEKAVFYMDAAISEDMRKDPQNWLNNPGSQFLTLNHQGNQVAIRVTKQLTEKISEEVSRFNAISSLPRILDEDFVNKFVKVLVNKKENHSIITALYSYILEFEDRGNELSLRGTEGGSIESALTLLFKGGLIFESLLKYLYPTKDNNKTKCNTLDDIFKTNKFKTDFPGSVKTNASSLQEIINATNNSLQSAFDTASKLRNTTGHNLVWDDVFNNTNNFKKLCEHQLNAIFYLIHKKFL